MKISSEADYVLVTKHAVDQLRQRSPASTDRPERDLIGLLVWAVHNSPPLAGQLGAQQLLRCDGALDGLVLVVRRTDTRSLRGGWMWVLATVLTIDQALGNFQAAMQKPARKRRRLDRLMKRRNVNPKRRRSKARR